MNGPMRRLDEVCSITMGQAPPGYSYNTVGDGLPLIAGPGDFDGQQPSAKKYTSSASKVCEAGDVVLGIRASIGARVWADKQYCLGRGVAGLRPGSGLDSRYLWHWLGDASASLAAKGRGATFLQVNRNDIGEMPIALPPLREQRRIAAILDQADTLRAKRWHTIAQIDALESSTFVEMFGHPVHNPQGLPLVPLSELGQLDRGVSRHRPRNDPSLLGGAYPLIQTGEVANSGGYIRTYSSTYSERGLAQSRMWPAGTLCITIAANIAKVGVLMFEACFPDSVVGFVADKETTTYVRVWLSFLQKTLEASAPQSAQKNINLAILRSLPVPLPKPERVVAFSEMVDSIQQQRLRAEQSLALTIELASTARTRAFAG